MASLLPGFHLYLTSYSSDFNKERDLLLKQVIPELREWLDCQNYQLVVSDIRWGGVMTEEKLNVLKQDLAQTASAPRFFLNVTSDSLGLVPHPDDHPPDTVAEYCCALNLSHDEHSILSTAHRPNARNAVHVFRDDTFLEYLLEEEEHFFVRRNILPDSLRQAVNTHQIPEKQLYRFKYDTAGWDYGADTLEIKLDIPKLTRKICDKVRAQIVESVLSNPPPPQPSTPVQQTDDEQTTFMNTYSERVRGRDEEVQELFEYITSGGKDVPVLLLRAEGSGKTCTLTKFTRLLLEKIKNKELERSDGRPWRVFYHFAGATPCSSELHPMLRQLLMAMEIVPESGLPKDVDVSANLCCMALSNPATHPIIVIVDAIDQFDASEKAAAIMSWVPRKLSPDVRCVFSSTTNSAQHAVLIRRESTPQQMILPPLLPPHRRQIVEDIVGGRLSAERVSALLAKPSSQNPLWLSIACQELATSTSAKHLDQRICSLPSGLPCLLEEVLQRLEGEGEEGVLLQATLCLLEASTTGLQQHELLHMLADDTNLKAPSPFDEKEEHEKSEKESVLRRERAPVLLASHRWSQVYETLRPFLRPVGPSQKGRLHFYHRALSRAVRKRYFHESTEENQVMESPELAHFWHQQLADYFQHCQDPDRLAEEYVPQLAILQSWSRLADVLIEWPVFERLYDDEYSPQLLAYWRQVASGLGSGEWNGQEANSGVALMRDGYKKALAKLEAQEPRDEKQLPIRYEQVARIFLQAGLYNEALDLCKVSVKWEEKDRMVELYYLMAEIYDEKLKLNDFVSNLQLPDLRKTISYGRKSIELRERLQDGPYHKFKLAMSLMKLAFSLESWEACGGDTDLSGEAALAEGNKHIDKAITMFKELKDMGHYAEALMTKGVLAPRGSSEQLKLYNEAQEICCQVYGDESLLASRLYINIGIVHEDNEDYVKALEFFRRWAATSDAVLGPEHPKTLRAKGVLKEPRYRLVAQRLHDMANGEEAGITEEAINQEAKDVTDRGGENRDEEEIGDGEEAVQNFNRMTEDLQMAINDLLQRAIGQVDFRQELLQNLMNSFQTVSAQQQQQLRQRHPAPPQSPDALTEPADGVLFHDEDTEEEEEDEDEEEEGLSGDDDNPHGEVDVGDNWLG